MTAVYDVLAANLRLPKQPGNIAFAIVQDNAHIPSIVCLRRAQCNRWRSVPELDNQFQKSLPSLPRRSVTPPQGTMFTGASGVTSPKTRNRSPNGANVLSRGQSSLPRVPRRKMTTSAIAKQLHTSPTKISDEACDSLTKLFSDVSSSPNFVLASKKQTRSFPNNSPRKASSFDRKNPNV